MASIKIEDDADDRKHTPTAKKSLLNGPRTPTPFKNALDEFRKIRGQTYVPSSPNGLVEDITEIMNKERQQDSTVDSVFDTDSSVLTQNVHNDSESASASNPKRLTYDEGDNSQQKKAKKSLDATWNESPKDFPYIVETPVSIRRIRIEISRFDFKVANDAPLFLQSKALNSNSGVAFSPPSIVKDTLGDSGLLLDPDMTITNSPENASAQVHNIINKIENKLMMRDRGNETRPLPNYHVHQQQFSFNRFKHMNNINVTATLNRQQQSQSSSVDSNQVQITNFIKLTDKNFPIKRYSSTTFNDSGVSSDNSMRVVSHEYNPFADENESFARFQLSKSVNNDSPNQTQTFAAQRPRAFGNDRTNFVQQSDRSYAPNSGKPTTFTRVEPRVSSLNAMTLRSMHVDTMSSNSNDENTVMFRNYDLNDEYWLNFE